jgi:hypothetical protein
LEHWKKREKYTHLFLKKDDSATLQAPQNKWWL